MPKAKMQAEARAESNPRYVKIVVFDDQNRLLAIKSKNRFILPGGYVEWDDDEGRGFSRKRAAQLMREDALSTNAMPRSGGSKNCSENKRTAIWATRASRDGGVDAVAFGRDFLLGLAGGDVVYEKIGGCCHYTMAFPA